MSGALLEVRGLSVAFDTAAGRFNAVEDVDLTVRPARCCASSASPAPARACRCWR